jgi:hypothetical protein
MPISSLAHYSQESLCRSSHGKLRCLGRCDSSQEAKLDGWRIQRAVNTSSLIVSSVWRLHHLDIQHHVSEHYVLISDNIFWMVRYLLKPTSLIKVIPLLQKLLSAF